MAQGTASGDRPSIGEANVALASLLSALKQSSASAAAGGPASSPAGQQAAASSPSAAGLTPQTTTGGPIAHSSPAYPPQPNHRHLQSSSSTAPPPPPPSSSNAPTPSLAADTPDQHQQHGHGHPHGTNWSGQTAAELSELGTYELLLQLGAQLGVMKPPPSATQSGALDATMAGPTGRANGQSNGTASATLATSHPATAPTPGDSSLRDSTYRPQPTRSGRMPQQSRPRNGAGDATDPSMSTLLFNDFFDFPSSEDEDDDPDFDPNAPADDFWGDLLARERADGDLTENEDAGWGAGGGSNGAGGGGSDAGAGTRSSGITSDEFAREIALLTSALNDPLPDLSGRSALPPQPTRTSPRRARTAATAFVPSPAEDTPEPVAAPARKKRKTTRRTLSPVLEDTPVGSSDPRSRAGSSRDVLPPPGQPLANLSPKARRTQIALPTPVVPSRYDGYGASDAGQRQAGPPSSSVASPSASPPPEAEAAPRTTRKYRQRERVYTPEEAAERRRVQQAERMAVRRKEEKEKKAQEEARIKGIEQENATLRERCRWLEEKCRDLEARLDAVYEEQRPIRSAPTSSRLRARPRRRSDEEPAASKAKPAATNGSSAKMTVPLAGLSGGGGDDDESDGGEYQVESSEESSSSGGDDDDDAEERGIDEDDLTPLAFPTDSSAAQTGTPATQTPNSSSGHPTRAGATAPGPVSLDLSSVGGPALSQLLTLVHAAANAQGISMPAADATHNSV